MYLRSSTDVGALIRDRRRKLRLGQATIARRIGVSRQWISGVERGHSRAELGLILRALDELGIHLEAHVEEKRQIAPIIPEIDIDAIIARARRP